MGSSCSYQLQYCSQSLARKSYYKLLICLNYTTHIVMVPAVGPLDSCTCCHSVVQLANGKDTENKEESVDK